MDLFKNTIILNNYNNQVFDFKNYLLSKDSIIWRNCKDLNIKIDSKINHLTFYNCSNIKLKCKKCISGLDIEKSVINIQTTNKNYLSAYKSIIKLNKIKLFNIHKENSKITE